MSDLNLFELLMVHHFQHNLGLCLDYVVDEMICPPTNKFRPVEEGSENKEYPGRLIFSNGKKLLDELVNLKFVDRRDIGSPIPIRTVTDFLDFLRDPEEEKKDGVYVYESEDGLIYRVFKIKELPKKKSPNLVDLLPLDFVHYEGMELQGRNPELLIRRDIGTRTRAALDVSTKVPHLNVHAYMEKQSGYTRLGFGKAVHTDKYGLAEEAFAVIPSGREHLLDEVHGIQVLHRRYERRDKKGCKIVSALQGPICIEGQRIIYGPKKNYVPQTVNSLKC